MTLYEFKCSICGIVDTITKKDFEMWGEPLCVGQGVLDDPVAPHKGHERVTMLRKYNAPHVVWPKSERGH